MITGLAHRGYPAKYAENTIPSFQAALDLHASHLELDVQLSKDGIPVVIHDPTLNRTTNGNGAVKSFTLEELRRLDAGGGSPIPTLEEVLLLAKGRAKVDIEFKQTGNLYPGLEQAVLEVIRDCDVLDQVFITSFDHYSIIRARELSPDVELGLVIYGATPSVFPLAEETRSRYVSVNYKYLTDDYVRECDNRGLQLIAWTVDHPESMRSLLKRYPHIWICTNELENLRDAAQAQA